MALLKQRPRLPALSAASEVVAAGNAEELVAGLTEADIVCEEEVELGVVLVVTELATYARLLVADEYVFTDDVDVDVDEDSDTSLAPHTPAFASMAPTPDLT